MDQQSDTNQQQVQQGSSSSELQRLLDIKQQALDALIPNLQKVDGVDPERKFEIYLMAVRFTHDVTILKAALDSAQQIEDSSAQSEALLDLIQELNYSINLLEDADVSK